MTWEPETPVRGEPLTVTMKGKLKDEVTSGSTVNVNVKWGLIVSSRYDDDDV
jgi:hypothetical protein